MAPKILKMNHLCLFNLLVIIAQYVYVIEMTPVCGRTDASSSSSSSKTKNTDKIYFLDQQQSIFTEEINGTIVNCFADGTIINATSNGDELKLRIENGKCDSMYHVIYVWSANFIQVHTNISGENVAKRVPARLFLPNVNECAENNQPYCTKNDHYPIEYVSRLLKQYAHEYDDAFSSDLTTNDVVFRIDAMDEDYLCDSFEKVIYPTSGKRKDGTELYIFNTDDHRQGVRVSLCQNRGEPCKMTENFPLGYTTGAVLLLFCISSYSIFISLSFEQSANSKWSIVNC